MELQHIGWNAITIGLFGTTIFTFIEYWGLVQQNRAIWLAKSGKSISVLWFCYSMAMFISMIIYGIEIKSIAFLINSILGIVHIPIIIGLWKYKGFSKMEKNFSILLIGCMGAMYILPHKDWFFLGLSFANIIVGIFQPWEIWKNKDAGVVEIKMLTAYTLGSSFWVIYAFAINDWVLKIVCPTFLLFLFTTIFLWFKYNKK